MDAPAIWLDGGGAVSDMSQAALDGDMQRRVLILLLAS